MVWSREDSLKLIEEFRKRECLWNEENSDYNVKEKTDDAWKEISSLIGRELMEAKEQMMYLIERFKEFLLKPPLGCDWFAFSSMLFLYKKLGPNKSVGAPPVSSSGCENLILSSSKRWRFQPYSIMQPADKEVKRIFEIADSMPKAMGMSYEKKDSYQWFGDHVASRLLCLSNNYARRIVMSRINDILHSANLGKYNYPQVPLLIRYSSRIAPHQSRDSSLAGHVTSQQSTPVRPHSCKMPPPSKDPSSATSSYIDYVIARESAHYLSSAGCGDQLSHNNQGTHQELTSVVNLLRNSHIS